MPPHTIWSVKGDWSGVWGRPKFGIEHGCEVFCRTGLAFPRLGTPTTHQPKPPRNRRKLVETEMANLAHRWPGSPRNCITFGKFRPTRLPQRGLAQTARAGVRAAPVAAGHSCHGRPLAPKWDTVARNHFPSNPVQHHQRSMERDQHTWPRTRRQPPPWSRDAPSCRPDGCACNTNRRGV